MSRLSDFYLSSVGGSVGGGGLSWTVTSDSTTADAGSGYLFDTSGGIKTLTLPGTPEIGSTVAAGDLKGTFEQYPLTISRNGYLIQGEAEDLLLDVKNQRVTLVYTGATDGWIITELEPAAVATYTAERKNLIINGNFDVWQRATSQTAAAYGSDDRWFNGAQTSTKTHSREEFPLGQIDVPGNPKYFSRTLVNSALTVSSYVSKFQLIEGVRTLSGQTATLSFWAKADSNKNIAVEFSQVFGTGGTPSAFNSAIGSQLVALTPTWQKKTVTVSIPSVLGKILGTAGNDSLRVEFWFEAGTSHSVRAASLGNQSGTFDIAQVQLEIGDKATDFERRTYGEEEQLCFRFFQSLAWEGNLFSGNVTSGETYFASISFLPMRATPTITATNQSTSTFPATYTISPANDRSFYESRVANGTARGHFASSYLLDAEL